MPASVLGTPELLMTMTDIAALAEVSRPAVTKWRTRHRNFPAPVGGNEAAPLFDPREVADWLQQRRTISRERAEQELSLFTLASVASNYLAGDVLEAVTALICLRRLAGEFTPVAEGAGDPVTTARTLAARFDPDDAVVLSEVRSIPADAGWLIHEVDHLVEASWHCRDAFEHVMEARRRFGGGALASGTVAPVLAKLIAQLSGAAERADRDGRLVVADAATGPGDLLTAVASLLVPDSMPEFLAAEPDRRLARLVRRRLVVHGLPLADIDVRVGEVLPDGAPYPDAIVTQIPYQPRESRNPLAVLNQVEDVALRLSRGRYGVVLGPASVLVDELDSYPPDIRENAERTRADLLAKSMVEAVIRLPGGVVPFLPGYETAIWVVTQARDSPWRGRLLTADVSDRELTHGVVSGLVEDVVTWRREGYQPGGHSRRYCRQVNVSAVVGAGKALVVDGGPTGPRERDRDAARRVGLVTQHGVDLDRIGATATADRRRVPVELIAAVDPLAPQAPLTPTETVAALVRGKRLSMRQGTRIKPEDVSREGHHVILGPDEVTGAKRPGHRWIDRAVFAQEYRGARLTQPDDVLVTTTFPLRAIVDTDGYSIAESGVRVLRILSEGTTSFTPRVLVALLVAAGSGSRPDGAVRGRSLEDCRLALLRPGQVLSLDYLLSEIEARRELARQELDKLAELQDAAIGGLVSGTLTITPYQSTGQDE